MIHSLLSGFGFVVGGGFGVIVMILVVSAIATWSKR